LVKAALLRNAALAVALAVPAGIVGYTIWRVPSAPPIDVTVPAPSAAPAPKLESNDDGHEDDRSYAFRIPSGEPTALSCDEARTIIDQARAGLAYPPEAVRVSSFASSAADWLDPHGLLSLAKDAPTQQILSKAAPDLLADLEGRRQRACASAMGPGAVLEGWVWELREAFDRGRHAPGAMTLATAALEPIPATGTAREMAEELGRRAGAFEAAQGDAGRLYASEARRRFFPPLDRAGWAKVVLASAVRAYVPLVDPHGEWAPFDEESRVYEVDLASHPPSRLWGHAVLTAVGVRVTEAPAPPLALDDVVLSVANMATAGLPLEQVDQLGFASGDSRSPLEAVVLREGKITALEIGRDDDAGAPTDAPDLPFERLAFGDGEILVVAIKDVRDDLGDDLATLLVDQKERGPSKLVGVVLDLRGNGGGSTDGALGALSLFLPGAPLFAMKRRDGTVEIDRAPVPRDHDRWTGPVATLVDGTTASAAEMIAGALAAYKRGPTVGTTTFGKGCAQEYVDDDAHAGVLRLTTLVYALPDGSPVQRIGLVPQIRFPFVPQGDPASVQEREVKLLHSAPPWRGPDVRDATGAAARADDIAWPAHGGNIGPCKDAEACKALRLLGGGPKHTPTAKH
jgi:carboxyl-terminal processing protease